MRRTISHTSKRWPIRGVVYPLPPHFPRAKNKISLKSLRMVGTQLSSKQAKRLATSLIRASLTGRPINVGLNRETGHVSVLTRKASE